MLILGKFKDISDVFKNYQKHKHFPKIFVCFCFCHLMLNCLRYKKNITTLQKLFIKILKKHSANKNRFRLEPTENMINYKKGLLSDEILI